VADALHDVDALPDFNPIAGEAPERLVHGGEQGSRARTCQFTGGDHEFGEEL